MTGVFHQEMFNFILKPQYRLLKELWIEHNIEIPESVLISNFDETEGNESSYLEESEVLYDKIMIYYGTETGTSLRYATSLAVNIGNGLCSGPFPMNDLPLLLQGEEYQTSPAEGDRINKRNKRNLILVLTSTFGKGYPPSTASAFMSRMKKIQNQVSGLDYGVFALGNSAFTNTFVAFGHKAHAALSNVGCRPVMNVLVADELKNQDVRSIINYCSNSPRN
jgi:sulfite reductase alpha subunit-like flavoprotein